MDNQIFETNRMTLSEFFARIYALVGVGILVSAVTSFITLAFFWQNVESMLTQGSLGMLILWLIPLFLVFPMQRAALKNSPSALPMFIVFSALFGFMLSFTLVFYTGTQITLAFVTAAGMFFGMSIYGRTTKRNLSGMGKAMIGALIGIIIAGILNFFIGSSMLMFGISVITVIVFAGLIAWDNQKIEMIYNQNNGMVQEGWAISMALSLYLDFLNLFLAILRIFGFMGNSRN
jgi:FtsH-binding integral membrane protein